MFVLNFSSLRLLIDKPPIGGKELLPLTPNQLQGFRLHQGPVGSIIYLFILFYVRYD